MQQIIDQITDHLISLVTSDKPEYNPTELLKSGIPSFVVERVRLFLEDKVREEIGVSESLWFSGNSRLVSDAHSDYVQSAIGCSHIPKKELYSVLSTVIKDIIYVFIEPRKKMAEYIFREKEELTLEELKARTSQLTIYKHFGTAIPLYMAKRELETLTKERCVLLIHKLDEKLVSSYKAEDWAQKLEQLFVLFGGKVDSILLSTFFEDKGLSSMAEKFKRTEKSIDREDFIEIISSNDLEDFAKENSVPEENLSTSEKSETNSTENEDSQNLADSFLGNDSENVDEDSLASSYLEGGLTEEEMADLLSDIASDGVVETDNFEQVDSLNKLFTLETDIEESISNSQTSEEIADNLKTHKDNSEDIVEFRENLISILDQAKHSFENISGKEEEEEPETIQEPIYVEENTDDISDLFVEDEADAIEESNQENILEEDPGLETTSKDEETEEKPIWAQFITEDQMDLVMGGERSKNRESNPVEEFAEDDQEEEIEVEDAYTEEPMIEDSIFESGIEEIQEVLIEEVLSDRKEEFIQIVFSDSETKYKKAIKKLEKFGSWQDASSFIQKDIYAKNEVDMFSGATVDFTDRLHRYFNEQRNK